MTQTLLSPDHVEGVVLDGKIHVVGNFEAHLGRDSPTGGNGLGTGGLLGYESHSHHPGAPVLCKPARGAADAAAGVEHVVAGSHVCSIGHHFVVSDQRQMVGHPGDVVVREMEREVDPVEPHHPIVEPRLLVVLDDAFHSEQARSW